MKQGRAIVLPFGPQTVGHGTHTMAAIWKHHLADLLCRTAQP